MKHLNLDAQSETVRKVLVPLSLDQGGTAVELNGDVVAYIVPKSLTNGHSEEPWTDEKNHRRCELIDRKYNGDPLTFEEEVELIRLQEEVGRHVRRVAPLPLEAARKLHQELLMKVNQTASQ